MLKVRVQLTKRKNINKARVLFLHVLISQWLRQTFSNLRRNSLLQISNAMQHNKASSLLSNKTVTWTSLPGNILEVWPNMSSFMCSCYFLECRACQSWYASSSHGCHWIQRAVSNSADSAGFSPWSTHWVHIGSLGTLQWCVLST